MDEQYLKEHHVIDRYLLGQLSDEEQLAFERYYFEHPEVLDEVALARSMQRGVVAALPAASDNGTRSLLKPVSSWLATPAWSMAATSAAAIFATMFILQPRPGANGESAVAQVVTAELMLLPTRNGAGLGHRPVIRLPPSGLVLLTADAGSLAGGELQIEIMRKNDSEPVAKMHTNAGADGLVILALPVDLLDAGDYILTAHGNSGKSVEYVFRTE